MFRKTALHALFILTDAVEEYQFVGVYPRRQDAVDDVEAKFGKLNWKHNDELLFLVHCHPFFNHADHQRDTFDTETIAALPNGDVSDVIWIGIRTITLHDGQALAKFLDHARTELQAYHDWSEYRDHTCATRPNPFDPA